ncbi:arabinose-5-phosphate isomerase [Enterococcus sp. AZ135]|uniref:KpsF/GutQ family sugar-phosphate isomerase n=1 Tax=unclassified Enterococcus TaxID=2608891 RepID=UPI003F207FC3
MSHSEYVRKIISEEIECLNEVYQKIDGKTYDQVLDKIMECRGKIIFLGVGKSGIIGKKLAATFSSTGTSSFFVHATEALHGDLGMIQSEDIVIMISNSGETGEVIATIPSIRQRGAFIISMTSNPNSSIAASSDIHLNLSVEREADPLDLAPTNSSTATLVIGDALALTLSKEKNFGKSDFAVCHPGGSLGIKSSQ